jgi:NADPH:quinone reductase-like Zn-dependent oxidoreductase
MLALRAAPGAPGALALGEAPDPQPRPDEALVAVRAVSLNRGEVRMLAGRRAGFVPGWDVAGEVLQPAADGGPPAGARVVGLVRAGAWAERAAVPISALAELPDDVPFTAAATLPVAGLTALRALAVAGPLLGRRVLVTGAAGGVGRFAIQLAARGGARVTAVSASADRTAGLAELGASDVVTSFEPEGPPFDVVLESVGGRSLAAALARVAGDGVVVSFGNSSGEPVVFDASSFYRSAGATLYAFLVWRELAREQSASRDLALLASMVAHGELRVDVGLEVAWGEAASAVAALLERRVAGKAVLLVG